MPKTRTRTPLDATDANAEAFRARVADTLPHWLDWIDSAPAPEVTK